MTLLSDKLEYPSISANIYVTPQATC